MSSFHLRLPAALLLALGLNQGVAKAGDTITIAPGAYDQDLAVRVGAARTANVTVVVAGG